MISLVDFSAIFMPKDNSDERTNKMDSQISIRSDRKSDYTFQYKGEDVTLKAGSIVSIADGLSHVVFPTCAMKIINNLIVIKEDIEK